ncbi:MAG: hypothetical protein AB8D52_05405 [Gammaproteobacteria bacterium]
MRKLFVVLGGVTLLTASAVSFAQRDHLNHFVERMTEKLQLNTTQVEQVTSIMEEQHAKKKALREETKTKLGAVLSDDQITKMEEMRRRHENWRPGKGKDCKKEKHLTQI